MDDAIADLGDLIEDRRQVGGVHISDVLTSWVSLTFDLGTRTTRAPKICPALRRAALTDDRSIAQPSSRAVRFQPR
jgi:hypothetical protein